MKTFILICLLIFCGCEGTMRGEYSGPENLVWECIDSRDGEKFKYNTDTISNVRIGFGGSSSRYDIVILTGEKKIMDSRFEEWIKCFICEREYGG